jgi:hypothetical protein
MISWLPFELKMKKKQMWVWNEFIQTLR